MDRDVLFFGIDASIAPSHKMCVTDKHQFPVVYDECIEDGTFEKELSEMLSNPNRLYLGAGKIHSIDFVRQNYPQPKRHFFKYVLTNPQ